MEKIDYEMVLADLEAKRTALDAAISGLRQWLGLGGSSDTVQSPPFLSGSDMGRDVKQDSFFGLSIPEAAIKYLRIVKQPQSTGQICDALKRGGLHSTSQNFITTVHSILSRREKAGTEIVKVKRGQWGLGEWYPGMRRGRAGKDSTNNGTSDQDQGTGATLEG